MGEEEGGGEKYHREKSIQPTDALILCVRDTCKKLLTFAKFWSESVMTHMQEAAVGGSGQSLLKGGEDVA